MKDCAQFSYTQVSQRHNSFGCILCVRNCGSVSSWESNSECVDSGPCPTPLSYYFSEVF
jgi:hypothetical protein